MLCSDCNKNNAEIFINKIENGVSSMEGLCRDCAKKRGIEIQARRIFYLFILQGWQSVQHWQ